MTARVGALPTRATSPVSLTDRTTAFEAEDMGAIPVRGTTLGG